MLWINVTRGRTNIYLSDLNKLKVCVHQNVRKATPNHNISRDLWHKQYTRDMKMRQPQILRWRTIHLIWVDADINKYWIIWIQNIPYLVEQITCWLISIYLAILKEVFAYYHCPRTTVHSLKFDSPLDW